MYYHLTPGPDAMDEIRYLSEHFFMTGLDKASNNILIMCNTHIRYMDLDRLKEDDFVKSCLIMEIHLSDLESELQGLLPEIQFRTLGLPYFMASYKPHKMTYRWLTSASHCNSSGIASMITQILKLFLEEIREWAAQQTKAIQLLTGDKFDETNSISSG